MSKPHYGGNLVDGAQLLSLFGDVATELCVRADGDEGLFRAYDSVEFLAPVFSGDFIEARGEIVSWGRTSLKMRFTAHKVIAPLSGADHAPSAAQLLGEPVLCCRASGTCVVPTALRRAALPGERIGRPGPCVITAAIVGAETTRAQTPHLPITAEEIGEEAARCVAAGASVIHLHVRDEAGNASQDAERFRAAIRAIRARCAPIIQTSTGGAVGMAIDERCGPLTLSGADAPDMATLNVGTINFGDDIFVNKRLDTQQVAARIAKAGIVPEVELYDLGHLDIVRELIDSTGITPHLISMHGQTIFHRPPLSLQLADPSSVALATRVPVISDLRKADLAAGGRHAGHEAHPAQTYRDRLRGRTCFRTAGACRRSPLGQRADVGTPAQVGWIGRR
mgnify:CR=1 FL=1